MASIDFDALAILIQQTITVEDGEDELSDRSGSKIGPPKTAAGRREVAIGPSGMAALRTWRDQPQATSPSSRLNRVIELKRELGSNTAVARELGVSKAAVRKQLRRSLTGNQANDIEQLYVFGSHNGASWLLPFNFRSHAWRQRLMAAGLIDDDGELIATPHDFRHHYASAAIAAGVTLEDLTYQLGHDSIDVTLKHYHLLGDKRERGRKVAALLETAMGAA